MTVPAFHPLANLFPLMEGAAFDELVADIKAHGVRVPVTMLDDLVLDGRTRCLAAEEAGVSIPPDMFVQLDPAEDPLAWVVSMNVKRRHLNAAQRAWLASAIANMPVGRNWKTNSANLPDSQANGRGPEACPARLSVLSRLLHDAVVASLPRCRRGARSVRR